MTGCPRCTALEALAKDKAREAQLDESGVDVLKVYAERVGSLLGNLEYIASGTAELCGKCKRDARERGLLPDRARSRKMRAVKP